MRLLNIITINQRDSFTRQTLLQCDALPFFPPTSFSLSLFNFSCSLFSFLPSLLSSSPSSFLSFFFQITLLLATFPQPSSFCSTLFLSFCSPDWLPVLGAFTSLLRPLHTFCRPDLLSDSSPFQPLLPPPPPPPPFTYPT